MNWQHFPCGLLFSFCLPLVVTAQPAEGPSDEQLLAALKGDSATRLDALTDCGQRLWTQRDTFFPAIAACIDDDDPAVRRKVVWAIGQYMIWNPGKDQPQSAQAIKFLIQHSHDDDPRTRYNAVYYGLSTVREKSNAVIDRLLELMIGPQDPHHNSLDSRVRWALRSIPDRSTSRIQRMVDSIDPTSIRQTRMLCKLHFELAHRFPTGLDRFQDDGLGLIAFTTQPTYAAENAAAVAEQMRSQCRDEGVEPDKLDVRLRDGEYEGVLLVRGLSPLGAIINRVTAGESLRVTFHLDVSLLDPNDQQRMLERLVEMTDDSTPAQAPDYQQTFADLYKQLGREYVHFERKGIDWKAVGAELLPRSENITTHSQFCLLCQELVARLEDSHAYLFKGNRDPTRSPQPAWDPGFACLVDDQDQLIVYHIDDPSPASSAGLKVGMIVTAMNDTPIDQWVSTRVAQIKQYSGYSSDRYLQYHVAQWLPRQMKRNGQVKVSAIDADGNTHDFTMTATLGTRYLPRLPVPIEGISDSASVSWKRLPGDVGYLYVRRIRRDLIEQLDAAIGELSDCDGLVIDVRGNSGGGFDAERSFRNFAPDDPAEPGRPRFGGPIAILIDSRCISAGEGWVSWFRAHQRATFFGTTTAGASGRKKTIDILGGDYKVIYSVKAYRGFLDRPIERQGIEPDVEVRHKASDIAKGIDTVLQTAIESLK